MKPWTIKTTCFPLTLTLNKMCDMSHPHAPVMAQDAKHTEEYTDEIVNCIHLAHRIWMDGKGDDPSP